MVCPELKKYSPYLPEYCARIARRRGADKAVIEADRAAAIARAIEGARAGDVVLIAGKGHENYQVIGSARIHFDDVEVAADAIRRRGSGV